MNKDQTRGSARQLGGKAQEAIGKATGDSKQVGKGLRKQAAGSVQKNYGDAKESIKDTLKDR